MAEHKLNNGWVFWYHLPHSKNSDWSIKGYETLNDADGKTLIIDTVEKFWKVYNILPTLANSSDENLWFLMREGIPPIWEHDINKEGGAFKFKIRKTDADNVWFELSLYLIGENLCIDEKDAELISGISISPKRSDHVTIRVWNLDANQTETAVYPSNILGLDFNKSLYEAHADSNLG